MKTTTTKTILEAATFLGWGALLLFLTYVTETSLQLLAWILDRSR